MGDAFVCWQLEWNLIIMIAKNNKYLNWSMASIYVLIVVPDLDQHGVDIMCISVGMNCVGRCTLAAFCFWVCSQSVYYILTDDVGKCSGMSNGVYDGDGMWLKDRNFPLRRLLLYFYWISISVSTAAVRYVWKTRFLYVVIRMGMIILRRRGLSELKRVVGTYLLSIGHWTYLNVLHIGIECQLMLKRNERLTCGGGEIYSSRISCSSHTPKGSISVHT